MNKDNYKNALNQIHASEMLKEKTAEKMKKQSEKSKISYIKILSSVAVIVIVFSVGLFEFNNINNNEEPQNTDTKAVATIKNDLPRFKNMDELKNVLKENTNYRTKGMYYNMDFAQKEESTTNSINDLGTGTAESTDYSKTNVQVENVDEADIVKTDGKYIFYVTQNKVFIVEANELNIVSIIEIKEDKKQFSPNELFINKDKLIVLGNLYEYEEIVSRETDEPVAVGTEDNEKRVATYSDSARITTLNTAKAIVYDISDKENVRIIREVGLDGNYVDSRMIGDNIYFISRKYAYYYDELKDNEILPRIQDTASTQENRYIECTDIAYFKDLDNKNYMLVGGFNINNNDELHVETFFGASETIYASQNNLYIAQTNYDEMFNTNTTIYKFNLTDSQILLTAKGEIEGYLNNQFSMDEYEGNLRIATTYTIKENMKEFLEEETIGEADGTPVVSIPETKYSNRLYILDENLKEIGRIDDLAKDEQIYAVRFVGKIGYIVTFEQVDPLFVIDLSNPTSPQIKGELKIPGYSSYLHPYDENHIIGIGYNTKSNGHGGITTDNMKMSMFDVSDLENPKEMFSIDIGSSYTHSEILYNHKVLFYKKSDNLIGFPISYNGTNRIELYKINLENGFEKYAEIVKNKNDFGVSRIIYIENIMYSLSYNKIISYNLENLEKIKELELFSESEELIDY